MAAHPPDEACHRLQSADVEVILLPDKGADIYAFVDRATGIDVLFKTPWGWRDPRRCPPTGTTQGDWLARYPGGWQILVPHAGPQREVDGVLRGFHGEAASVPWRMLSASSSAATLTVDLRSAPLRLTRQIALDGPVLRLHETVENLSPDPVAVSWVHHPGFGAPFIDENCRLDTGARTIITDGPGPIPEDLRRPPAAGQSRAVFASLTNFAEPWFALTSPTYGFGIAMAWDHDVFPHAWLWQEFHHSPGYPWYRRAYVFAVEPANVLHRPDEQPPVLGGGECLTALITMSRFATSGRTVTYVDAEGAVYTSRR